MQFGFGAGVLYGVRNDIANGQPVRFGALQDVGIEWDGEIKELYGQSQFALDVARGKTKISGKAKYAQINAVIMANMFFGTAATAGSTQTAYNEAGTVSAVIDVAASAATASGNAVLTFASVPAGVGVGASVSNTTAPSTISAGTYVLSKTSTTVTMSANATGAGVTIADSIRFGPSVQVSNYADYVGDLGVFYSNTGNPLSYVASAPAAGEYSETNGLYVFNSADAAADLLFNYLWLDSATGFTIAPGNPLMGTTPKFQATFNQNYGGNSTTLRLYSCVSQKLSLPTKIDDYVIQEFDFMAFANAAGQTFELSTTS